jgi:hypothetical protein
MPADTSARGAKCLLYSSIKRKRRCSRSFAQLATGDPIAGCVSVGVEHKDMGGEFASGFGDWPRVVCQAQ